MPSTPLLPARISLDQAAINREALATDQALRDAAGQHGFEEAAQKVAVPEAAVPVFRERGVVRHPAVEPEAAEPAIGEVQVDLVAEPPFRPDAEAVAHDQHADHQLRIDRGPARLAVERRQLPPQPCEIDETVDRPEQVVGWHVAVEREVVEQRALLDLSRPHHLLPPPPLSRSESAGQPRRNDSVFQRNMPGAEHRPINALTFERSEAPLVPTLEEEFLNFIIVWVIVWPKRA